jgi:hypothetical protein
MRSSATGVSRGEQGGNGPMNPKVAAVVVVRIVKRIARKVLKKGAA